MCSELPDLFVARLADIIPKSQFFEVLMTFSIVRPPSFRVNSLIADVDAVRAELSQQGFTITPIPWHRLAFCVPAEQRRLLTETAAFHRKQIYIQGLASMIVPLLLDPKPDENILDLAAAPGGKTLQLAAQMQNRGRLAAVEAVKKRYFKLKANLEGSGAAIVRTYLSDGRSVGNKCPEQFDRVLLDVPCSSEARISRRDPDSWRHWNLHKIKEMNRKQRRLLHSAIRSLKPGGTLVYSTCSFAPEENEMVLHQVLQKYGTALQVVPIELPIDNVQGGLVHWREEKLHASLAKSVRILPTSQMQGLFVCKLIKTRST